MIKKKYDDGTFLFLYHKCDNEEDGQKYECGRLMDQILFDTKTLIWLGYGDSGEMGLKYCPWCGEKIDAKDAIQMLNSL